MELKEKMYVRTSIGIKKIDHIDYKKTVWKYLYKANEDNEFYALSDNDIINASLDIIDLLEEGDLVGIEYYSTQSEEKVTRLFEVDYKYGKSMNLMNSHFQFLVLDGKFSKKSEEFEPVIKTIVTKEQIKQISYKVGEKI